VSLRLPLADLEVWCTVKDGNLGLCSLTSCFAPCPLTYVAVPIGLPTARSLRREGSRPRCAQPPFTTLPLGSLYSFRTLRTRSTSCPAYTPFRRASRASLITLACATLRSGCFASLADGAGPRSLRPYGPTLPRPTDSGYSPLTSFPPSAIGSPFGIIDMSRATIYFFFKPTTTVPKNARQMPCSSSSLHNLTHSSLALSPKTRNKHKFRS
jgi:hypothetical protein